MENAAPVTTLCGQLAALKTQTFHVESGVEEEEKKEQKSFTGTI